MRIENVKNADIHFNLSLQCIEIALFVCCFRKQQGGYVSSK